MPDERTQINFVLDAGQKERWEAYVRDSRGEYRGMSQLIRRSVEKEMGSDDSSEGTVPETLTQQLSDLIEGMNRVENRLHDLDNRVATIEREVREDPDVKGLANELFGILPTKQEVIDFVTSEYPGPDIPDTHSGKLSVLATVLDVEEYRVLEAFDKLGEDTYQVGTFAMSEEIEGFEDDVTRYYREV